jgi:uncharacterized RDD family membrane protein YckC
MLNKHKAHPDQAGFLRRTLAFMIDNLLIMVISVIVFFAYSETMAARHGGKGEFSRMVDALKKGQSVVIGANESRTPIEAESPTGQGKLTYFTGGEKFKIFYEFIIGYLYYVLFFRFGGRTPGKRLLRLKVVDLEGRPHLGWYQSLERAHGYAASTLLVFLGFLQVLWDHQGLTMHDKLAGTTVVRLKKT